MKMGRSGRLILLALVILALAMFYLAGGNRLLDWEHVRLQIDTWKAFADEHFLLSLTLFVLVYLGSVALSLPIAMILSLIGGALFGRVVGVLAVSLSSTLGASLAFLGSRYLLRDWVRTNLGARLAPIDHGIHEAGAWYLLTLRLMPVVPFFLINLGLGLTPMRLTTFAGVSWLGMLPATVVIVNAGTALADLEKPSDALSPTFVLSLALLGLFPLLIRYGIGIFIARKSTHTKRTG